MQPKREVATTMSSSLHRHFGSKTPPRKGIEAGREAFVTRLERGQVPSAVMFQAGLRPGLTMLQVVRTTKSLGRKVDGSDDDWLWADEGGDSVRLHFEGARLATWQLERAA